MTLQLMFVAILINDRLGYKAGDAVLHHMDWNRLAIVEIGTELDSDAGPHQNRFYDMAEARW